MKVYEIDPGEGLNKCTEENAGCVVEWLEEMQTGETLTIRVKEMDEDDFESLPEYEGP